MALAAVTLAAPAAEARCVRAGHVFSCTTLKGEHELLSCFGTGIGVQTCVDARGNSLLVGTHWHTLTDATPTQSTGAGALAATDSATFSTDLSNALAANPAFGSNAPAASTSKKKGAP